MDGPARKVVHGLKYRGIRALAGRMAAAVGPVAPDFDVAMPVPLHGSRQRRRGFNQAELMLNELACPRAEGRLLRIRNTPHQVGLHHGERRSNVAGAFAYRGPSLTGLTVALVDDVVTTGATVNECARVLRDYGARHVIAVAYARASYDSGSVKPIPD
jgi:ComF family protein